MRFAPAVINPMASPLWNNESVEWVPATITDFTGGLCTAFSETNIRNNQFTILNNWYFRQDGSIEARGPFRPYLVTTAETILATAPLSFTWMELGGSDYLIAQIDTKVQYWNSTVWADIKTSLTSGYKTQFAKFSVNDAEDLIFCNGKDVPQRWTGSGSSSDLGLTVPAVPSADATSAATVSGRGLTINGTYYYQLTYFYDSSGTNTKYGESGPSTTYTCTNAVSGAATASPQKITLTVPALTSGTTTKVNIYRSPADESNGPFEYVGYATSTTFEDTCPNGEEGVEVPADVGTPPVGLKNILSFKGRVMGVGLNSSGQLTNKGVYSNSGQPDMFSAENYFYVPDALVGPVAFGENVYWFTEKQIYITPNGDFDTYPQPLKICDRGCTSFDSIVDVGNGLVFQSDDNIYWVDFNSYNETYGDFPFPVGEPIGDKIQAIDAADRINSAGCLYRDRYYLSYTGTNQTVNTATLVWDIVAGVRLLKQGLYGGWSSLDWCGNDLQSFDGTLWSADNTNKYIMEHDFAGADDYYSKTEYTATTVHNIITELKTKKHLFVQSPILVRSMLIQAVTSGATYTASLSFDDASFEKTVSIVLGTGTLAVDSNWLIWGQGTWGNFNWGASSKAAEYSHKKIPSGGKGRDIQITLSSSDTQDTNITELTFYYKLLPRRLGS